ncbi:MAG: hypothetical protein LBT56_02895 [Prevotellaceae bacterium]|jgi:hypothetical protein|nr:hypothetical protein [Prevotellaceae bacterium]
MIRTVFSYLVLCLLFGCASRTTTIERASTEVATTIKATSVDTFKQYISETIYVHIPEQQSSVKIAITDVENLPNNAQFSNTNGRASVALTRQHDTITVTAICDSLQQLSYNYELLITNYERKIEQQNSEIKLFETEYKKTKYGFSIIAIFIIGAAVGFIAGGLLSKKKSVIDTILNFIKTLFK